MLLKLYIFLSVKLYFYMSMFDDYKILWPLLFLTFLYCVFF